MKSKKKERKHRERLWEEQNRSIQEQWRKSPQIKAALRAKGCNLSFFDTLDSYESEFKKLVAWAKGLYPSLHEVYETDREELDKENDFGHLSLPGDWEQVYFACDDNLATSYNARDTSANLRGATTGFHDKDHGFHTIIQILKNPDPNLIHKERKYALKLPVLLHEIGHVKDYEQKINFDRDTKQADLIEGEVFAHIFALDECFGRGYHVSGEFYFGALEGYKDETDHRGEIVRRLLARYSKPDYRKITEYDV